MQLTPIGGKVRVTATLFGDEVGGFDPY
jgi:hypothetical protein